MGIRRKQGEWKTREKIFSLGPQIFFLLPFFSPTKQKIFPPSYFSTLLTKHTRGKTKYFQSSHNFSSSHFSTPPSKRTLSVVNDWLEVVSHLSNLTTLSLWGCDLPSQMLSSPSGFNYWKSLTSLESLDLDTNKLVSLPKSIGDICTLRELYFLYNNPNVQLVELIM